MFEDLNYEELKRRANSRLPERVLAALEARGTRRSVAVGEMLYRVDDRQYPFVYAVSATLASAGSRRNGVGRPRARPSSPANVGLLLGQTSFSDCIAVKAGEVVLVAALEIADLVQSIRNSATSCCQPLPPAASC